MSAKNELNILQITDIHIGNGDASFSGCYTAVIEDISKIIAENKITIDAIIMCGDTTQCGRREEYTDAREYITKLVQKLNSKPVIYLTPGNHDIVRPSQVFATKTTNKFNRLNSISKLKNKSVCEFIDAIQASFNDYSTFESEFLSNTNPLTKSFPGTWATSIKCEFGNIGLISLNTSILHYKDIKEGDLHLPRWHLHEIVKDFEKWRNDHEFSILLTHHPLSWLHKDSIEWIKEELFGICGIKIHFCGHEHVGVSTAKSQNNFEYPLEVCGHAMNSSPYFDQHGHSHERKIGYAIHRIEKQSDGAFALKSIRRIGKITNSILELDYDDSHHGRNQNLKKWTTPYEIRSKASSKNKAELLEINHERLSPFNHEAAKRLLKSYEMINGQLKQTEQINKLFSGIVLDRDKKQLKSPMTAVLDLIKKSSAGDRIVFIGQRGAGRGAILALIYKLYTLTHSVSAAQFIDTRYINGVLNSDITSLTNVVFFISSQSAEGQAYEKNSIIDKSHKFISVTYSDQLDPTNQDDKLFFLNQEIGTEPKWLQLSNYLLCNSILKGNSVAKHAFELNKTCQSYEAQPGLFLAEHQLSQSKLDKKLNLGNYIYTTACKLISNHQSLISGSIQENYKDIFKGACEIEFAKQTNVPPLSPPSLFAIKAHEHLINLHPCFSNLMVAFYEMSLLSDLGRTWKTQSPPSDANLNRLNAVFPNSVNVFVKDLLSDLPSGLVENNIINALIIGVGVEHSENFTLNHRLLRANFSYLLGRFKKAAHSQEALEEQSRACRKAISELKAIASLVSNNEEYSAAFNKNIENYVANYSVTNRIPVSSFNLLKTTKRIISELKLIERSALISLAVLGNETTAFEYITHLATNPVADSLNRGFHLDYYGDKARKNGEHFISHDSGNTSCEKTINALITGITNGGCPLGLKLIQCFTLGSLIRARCLGSTPSVSDDLRKRTCETIENFINDNHSLLPHIEDTLASFAREIEIGNFLVERYIDDLYSIKFQLRTGWPEELAPKDSVAAHSFMSIILSQILLPTYHDDLHFAEKNEIINALAFHDLAEAITSDIPTPIKKTNSDIYEREEKLVMHQISRIGLLTGSQEGAGIGTWFEKFNGNVPSNDMDRLELLIQTLWYYKHNGDFKKYSDFIAYCKPENFKSHIARTWAERFISYYSKTTLKHTKLWLIDSVFISI